MQLRDKARAAVLEEIEKLKDSEHKKLPTEAAMCKKFGISRVTLRSALADLDREGKIVRVQGRGTFVNTHFQNKNVDLFRMDSYTRLIEKSGYQIKVKTLDCQVVDTPDFIRKINPQVEEKIVLLSKVFYADKKLAVLCIDYLPMEFIQSKDELLSYEDTIFKYLYDKYQIRLESGNMIFHATSNEEMNTYLKKYKLTCEKENVLLVEGADCNQDGKVIMYTREFVDTDIIQFSAIRRRAIDYISNKGDQL